jgi:hypothetical protein
LQRCDEDVPSSYPIFCSGQQGNVTHESLQDAARWVTQTCAIEKTGRMKEESPPHLTLEKGRKYLHGRGGVDEIAAAQTAPQSICICEKHSCATKQPTLDKQSN